MDSDAIHIRVSNKLGKKIDSPPEQDLSMHENPYLDWSAHLFRAPRKQYILFTNTASLYSVVIRGKGVTHEGDFIKSGIRSLKDMLEEDGLEFMFERLIAPALGEYYLGKALNRTVIGSMNDLVRLAQSRLEDGDISPFETARKLNETPFSYLDYGFPKEAFQELDVGHTESK